MALIRTVDVGIRNLLDRLYANVELYLVSDLLGEHGEACLVCGRKNRTSPIPSLLL